MLFVLVVLVWIGLDESVRRQFTGFQRGTLVFLALLLLRHLQRALEVAASPRPPTD